MDEIFEQWTETDRKENKRLDLLQENGKKKVGHRAWRRCIRKQEGLAVVEWDLKEAGIMGLFELALLL